MRIKFILKHILFPVVEVYSQLCNRVIPYLFRVAVQKGYHRIAAVLFVLTIRRMPTPVQARGKPAYHLFVLRKLIFDDDIIAAFGQSPEFRLYGVSRRMVKIVAHVFLPDHLVDLNYRSRTPEDTSRKQAYREFLIRMWPTVQRLLRCDAMISGNFTYHAEQELAGALEHLAIPFIAVHKESLRPAKLSEFYAEHYRTKRTPFWGRKILVYNELERQAQITGNIVSPERIMVTGAPRFDNLHAVRLALVTQETRLEKRPNIVFFFFTRNPLMFLEHTDNKEWCEKIQWNRLLDDTFRAMVQLARESQDMDVVIKSKSEKVHSDVLNTMLARIPTLPENLKIQSSGNPLQLIMECDVVCGFNTTAVLDALILDRPVVVPRFAEALNPEFQPFIVDFEDAVEYADSPEELISKLRTIAQEHRPSRKELPPDAVRVLKKWVGNDDGRAAERVRQTVIAEIEGY